MYNEEDIHMIRPNNDNTPIMAVGVKIKTVFTTDIIGRSLGQQILLGVTNFNHFKYCDYIFASEKAKRKNVDSKHRT